MAFGLGGTEGLEDPGGPELRDGGCSLGTGSGGGGGVSGLGPRPPNEASGGGSEEDSEESEHLRRVLYPCQRPSPFRCQADSGLLSKEQLLDSWQNNGDPAPRAPSSWDR